MNPARKLIEEARRHLNLTSALDNANDISLEIARAYENLGEALALIPDWIKFDPEREETWPKESDAEYEVTIVGMSYPDKKEDRCVSIVWWFKTHWDMSRGVVAYRKPPEPYQEVKP